jgi:hypothetical protein
MIRRRAPCATATLTGVLLEIELGDSFQRGRPRVVGAVQGADARAENHVGDDPVRGERVEHADLNGAETPAAREDKGCFRLIACHRSMLEHDPEKWEPVFGKDHAPPKTEIRHGA